LVPTTSPLLGRELELGVLEDFVCAGAAGARSLVLEGPAGIGKTSVWQAGLEAARSQGVTVLVSRPAVEDVGLGFAGLADLLDGVQFESLVGVSAPKRRALEVALALRDSETSTDRFVVCSGVLAVLRALAAQGGVVVAIDDLQWLDDESRTALAFALRRLVDAEVRLLATERTAPDKPGLEPLGPAPSERLALGPLSFAAIGRLVHERLGVSLQRWVLRRLHELSAGNPLLALELARSIAAGGSVLAFDQALTLDGRVDALLAERIAGLGPASRRTLLAAALSPAARLSELQAVVGEDAVDAAVKEDVVIVEGTRVRLSHPLLGAVATGLAGPSERRDLHRRIAQVVEDPERRAIHLAGSCPRSDSGVAAVLADAAAQAARRGAAAAASELGERALALTPRADPGYGARVLEAAEHNYLAGRLSRSVELLEPALDSLERGPLRARALCVLADCESSSHSPDLLRRAIAEVDESEPSLAPILNKLAFELAVAAVGQLAEAEKLARRGLAIAVQNRDREQQAGSVATLIWLHNLGGQDVDQLADTEVIGREWPQQVYAGPNRALAVGRMWRGEIGSSRGSFESMLALADERGQTASYYIFRVQLCELELRAGRFDLVQGLLDEWAREQTEQSGHHAGLLRFQALLLVGRGDSAEGSRVAAEAVAAAERVQAVWHRLEAQRALGLARLLAGDPHGAAESLREPWEHVCREGIENPGAFPLAPDLVEALARANRIDEARAVLDRLSRQARAQRHPWGTAAAAYAHGQVLLAAGEHEQAMERLGDAAGEFEALDLPFDQARSQLAKGTAERRLRRKRDARISLQQAILGFDRLGAPGWTDLAQAELDRIGGRRAPGRGLTATEQRVADLVAQGLANKEIAAVLVVSVRTVEAHLTRVYAKLGVRSRTALTRELAGRPTA
jgi:DNA-binding CsgD family transcriptional regulator